LCNGTNNNIVTLILVLPFSSCSNQSRSRSESSLFRSLYIDSDFQSTPVRQALNTERTEKQKQKLFCRHGVAIGLCREICCWEIDKVEVEGAEKRGVGTITGLRNWEYLIRGVEGREANEERTTEKRSETTSNEQRFAILAK